MARAHATLAIQVTEEAFHFIPPLAPLLSNIQNGIERPDIRNAHITALHGQEKCGTSVLRFRLILSNCLPLTPLV